ncbi:Flp/Fap pilin component [Anaeromyxobacter dehalogenans 2CP-1]|uniref:Flp/Fap pilin component n=1 Tax=Anaeromyxobacter dehalogenans (strain ATCC BAA-258 / DSM 21875 / 2CP-1) TaxID=455488 RepID=B8JFG0_ANAD2|nr:Flp family type IVb pilin [Anaeromyxobacter dehalogenans]ACL66337.1 Flp/Fap pilin component [Anaeromyxobacter dehalogenans 2CP-1]
MPGTKGDSMLRKLWKDDEGATAVEYGLMVAAIAAVIVVVVFSLGGRVNTAFQTVDTTIGSHQPAAQ